MSRYYIAGRQIQLDKLIGEGGEGKVYTSSSNPSRVIKIYSDPNDTTRAEKIQKMISLELAKKSDLISFPDEVVTSENGKTLGFSMNFVKDHQQVHNLYGVKSRRQLFPDADYRFLVRVAANIARAIAQVHTYPCVIGDINHSGVLVSKNATIALIDADSFQIKDNGKLYPCVVGVPDFTPPELQGKSLRNLERTQTHDQFGLAVLIFQLLVMGRHPFHGRGRDLTQEESIAQFLFAYTQKSSNGITPPPGVPTLSDFPPPIASAFEYSFGPSGVGRRTSALEWVALLQELESSLQKCSINSRHFFPASARNCPWCRMESQTGAILFNGGIALLSSSISLSEIERFIADLNSFNVDENNLFPKLPSLNFSSTSYQAQQSKKKKLLKSILSKISFAGIAAAVLLAINYGGGFLLLAGALWWLGYKIDHNEEAQWKSRFNELDERWSNKVQLWREKTVGGIFQTKYNIEKAVAELKHFFPEKESKLAQLKNNHRAKQLEDYLDKFLIKNAKIEHIHKSLVASLASYGIESAADIDAAKIRNIPQFGDKRTSNLVSWRRMHEQGFKYNPALQTNDIHEQNKITNEFELKMRDKKGYIEQQKRLFDQARSELNKQLELEDPEISSLFLEREQLKADFAFLNMPLPASRSIQSSINKPVFTSGIQKGSGSWGKSTQAVFSSPTPQPANTPNCPNCNSLMVKRWGNRGGFWGCSRYPRCRGTRNY